MQAISAATGLDLSDGRIIAFDTGKGRVVFALTNYGQNKNVELHICGRGDWGRRTIMRFIFKLIFDTMGCERCTALVDPKNEKVIKLLQRVGYSREGVIRWPDRHVYLYGLLKKECRYYVDH